MSSDVVCLAYRYILLCTIRVYLHFVAISPPPLLPLIYMHMSKNIMSLMKWAPVHKNMCNNEVLQDFVFNKSNYILFLLKVIFVSVFQLSTNKLQGWIQTYLLSGFFVLA